MSTVDCSSSYRVDQGQTLTPSPDLIEWLSTLPPVARLSAIRVDVGNQRDPMHVLVGLRAAWKEER